MLKEKEIERGQPRKLDKTILKEKEIERGQQREVDKTMKKDKTMLLNGLLEENKSTVEGSHKTRDLLTDIKIVKNQ